MNVKETTGNVLIAGVTTAAATAFVVGHMLAIEWVGRKLREYVRSA